LESQYVAKAIRMLKDKGVSLAHLMAELLLCKYLSEKNFSCDIEFTIGDMKCDVYAKIDNVDTCIEIIYYTLPLETIDKWSNILVSIHLKKLIKMSKNKIMFAAFAYPLGLIPLIPPKLLDNYTKEVIVQLSLKYMLDEDVIAEARELNFVTSISKIYIFDLYAAKVEEVLPSTIKNLLLFYESILRASI